MGTQEGDRDWVDVANNLLNKCQVNLRLGKLTDCDANVFISLYENILGEKVPDYFAAPCSQEDSIHNVQSVIDSLSLDYLQISLSHITGENVVRGNKESIKNLLEIFDGLLEYLNEEICEESQNGGLTIHPQTTNTVTISGPLDAQDTPLTEPIHPAIALKPPNQSNTPQDPDTDTHSASLPHPTAGISHGQAEAAPFSTEASQPVPEVAATNGLESPAVNEKSLSSQHRGRTEDEGEILQPTNRGARKVIFRMQPDVLFLTVQDELAPNTPSPPDTKEEEEQDEERLRCTQRLQERRTGHKHVTGLSNRLGEDFEEPLSYRRQRNRKAEEELHNISENLSHRLKELDQMLKQVLGESGESSEIREKDKQSHHSDSVMECRKMAGQWTVSGTPDSESTHHTSSLLPSPPRALRSLQGQLADTMAEALELDDGRQTNLTSDNSRRGDHRLSHRKHSKYVEMLDYEDELKRYEVKKWADVDKARLKAQEAEREYREAILSDVSPPKTKDQHRSQRTQTTPGRRWEANRKAQSMKVKENELLPVLLEELPHLYIAPQALGQMWEQQMQQVDRLHTLSSSHNHWRRSKLFSQVEDAQKKHDLQVEIIRKEQDHSRRLRDYRDRIEQQKSTRNRVREQRQQIARAKKYHNDYHVYHRARLMKTHTKEEKMFRQLFEEGLELQKIRLREQMAYAREQQLEHQRRHQDQIKSMENYYKDQFSLLAEKLAQERQEIQVRKKAQEKALLKMKQELRSRMEREICELQKIIVQNNEDNYTQNLEVQRLRNQIHMASFQYNTSCLH